MENNDETCELTELEKEYLEVHIPKRLVAESTLYYDEPAAALEDIEFLLKIIEKLKKQIKSTDIGNKEAYSITTE